MGKRQLLNVLPNFAGVGAGLLFPLLFNIVYYRLLGTEGYGLIGFYGLLAIIATLMDLGLSQTTLREVARRASDHDRAGELQSLVLTLALISCGLGALLGLLAVASSKWLATSWLGLSRLSVEEVSSAIATMGGVVALVFPANILNAALRGLQRQILFNTIAIAAAACRGVAMIAAMYVFGATPLVFFSAQLLMSICEVVLLGVVVGGLLPASVSPPRFDFRLFQASWRFAFTVWLSIAVGQVILLSDKMVMSAVLPLDLFGLYSIAFAVASTVQRLATPFSNAYLPHLVELFEKQSFELLSQAYHLASQLASAVVICAGLLLVIYAQPIMLLLTADPAKAGIIAPVFAILAAANTLAALMVLPQMLQIGCGAPWIGLRINSLEVVPYVALLVLLAPRIGMYAPAGLWLAAGLANLPIMTIMTHRVVLQGQAWRWFRRSILLPAIAAAAVLVAGAVVAPEPSPVATTLWLAVNYALALAAALLCAFGGKRPDLGPPRGNVTNGPATVPPGSPRTPERK
jgi:O-antigen/teichoic acid export membrane protein